MEMLEKLYTTERQAHKKALEELQRTRAELDALKAAHETLIRRLKNLAGIYEAQK